MVETVSKYKNNLIAKKSRVFFAGLMEYGLVLISSLLIFYLTLLGSSKLPVSTKNVEKYNQTSENARKFVNSTRLLHYDDETGEVRDINVDAKNYVATLVKTSCFVYDIKYPLKNDNGTYDTDHVVTEQETFIYKHDEFLLDNVSYFWLTFYPNNEFNDTKQEIADPVSDIYLNKMGYSTKESVLNAFVTEEVAEYQPYKDVLPRYTVLTKDNTQALINVVVYSDTTNSTAADLFENIKIGYKNGIQAGIDMVEEHSLVYLDYSKDFMRAYNALSLVALVSYLIAYVVGYVAVMFIGRAMAGEFITMAQKSLSLAPARKDEMAPTAKNLILYHVITFFTYLSSMAIALYFTGYIGALNLVMFGPFNVFAIEILSLVFVLASIIILMVTKKNQTFGLLVSNMVLKDVKEFESAVVDGDRLLTQEAPVEAPKETPKEDGNEK